MPNLLLSVSTADLTRLRTLVAAVDKEIALLPGATKPADKEHPNTALAVVWANLVELLDLGPEPETRACPQCGRLYPVGDSRCGHCWATLATTDAT